ncbi:unnamed protein product [Musa banksii]
MNKRNSLNVKVSTPEENDINSSYGLSSKTGKPVRKAFEGREGGKRQSFYRLRPRNHQLFSLSSISMGGDTLR